MKDPLELLTEFAVFVGGPVVLLAALNRAIFGQTGRCRALRWPLAVTGGALLLLAGGGWLLGRFGLAWRNLPANILMLSAIIGGAVCAIMTVLCMADIQWKSVPLWLLSTGAVTVCALALCAFLLLFGVLTAAFGFGRADRTVEYRGELLVEEDVSWTHPNFDYYRYYGPLFRGSEWLFSSSKRLGEDK